MVDGPTSGVDRAFLIADIRGYTAYTAERGDEAGSRLAAEFAILAAEAVEAWAGRLVELRGDEALCVFDDPVTALYAAVELQDAFADEVAIEPRLPLRVGIGVATGEAVAVADGFRGSALNLAARLCAIAKAGEVNASARLVDGVGPVAGLWFEPINGLVLKGMDAERLAFRVHSERVRSELPIMATDRPSHEPPALPPELDVSVPLAGRAAELRWLGWHWRRARRGHARTIWLDGERGCGRTRLVAELATRAVADGARVDLVTTEGDAGVWPGFDGGSDTEPCLRIVESGAGDTWVVNAPGPIFAEGVPLLNVVIPRHPAPGRGVVDSDRRFHLQVRPLGMEGVRALAASLAPDTVDELPIARILEASGGLPRRVREQVLEWDERIEAEHSSGPAVGSLPAEPSSFVGRAVELRTLVDLLQRSRLITLIGPPGTGKTRLALRLAKSVSETFPGGTFFVPLAALRDQALVDGAIARALQLRVGGETTALEVVGTYLSERTALLVLDNFEHVLEAATGVSTLLKRAPGLKVVVTSRTSLGLSGEQVYPVPPLDVPPADSVDAETVAGRDASALFVARAQAADPSFELRPDTVAVVARICARLEGLPLAIELAAARVRTLGCHQLLEHLDRRLPLLTGGPADVAERHQTMRDAIAWSYELLAGSDQAALRHLSVFRGGFTLGAAARVTGSPDVEIVDVIDGLVARSLVHRVDDRAHVRYGMLELIREFCLDELVHRAERAEAFRRHCGFFLDLAHEIEPVLDGEDAKVGADRLAPEIDNLRAALERSMAAGDAETALDLAASTWRFWQSIGQLGEGHTWLEHALQLSGGSTTTRAKATAALGGLAYWQGDFDVARESYRRSRDLYTAAGDRRAESEAVYSLSLVATLEGDLEAAERYADEAMEMVRGFGDEARVGEVLMAQTTVAWKRGELTRAAGLNAAALEISQRLGMRSLAASQLVGVAGIAFMQGDVETALQRAGEAVELAIETGNTHTQLFALESLASFAAEIAPEQAVRLCAATSSLRAEHGGGWTLESFGVACARSGAESMLDREAIESAWDSGKSLDLDAATELGRSILITAEPGSIKH